MQIEVENPELRRRILDKSMRRATKWIKLSQEATPMVEQVGGRKNKKPVLTMSNEYVLKPLSIDHRGIREVAFYEALSVAQSRSNQQYTQFLSIFTDTPNNRRSSSSRIALMRKPIEILDALAMTLAMLARDSQVQEAEANLRRAWRAVRQEVECINHLNKFVPRYFGVVKHEEGGRILSFRGKLDNGISPLEYFYLDGAYLLLSRLSERFSRPCIMDVKMGQVTFEPDAPEEKIQRESIKYPKQEVYGFRITGMRIYDPSHPDADENGCRFFDKDYGRSLHTPESVREAFRLFFSCDTNNDNAEDNSDGQLRRRVVSNVLLEVRSLRKWFEDVNKNLEFRASSLLLIYDADQSSNGDVAMVRMIDFGRVRRKAGGDPGYRFGLRTVKKLLTDLLAEETVTSQSATDRS